MKAVRLTPTEIDMGTDKLQIYTICSTTEASVQRYHCQNSDGLGLAWGARSQENYYLVQNRWLLV